MEMDLCPEKSYILVSAEEISCAAHTIPLLRVGTVLSYGLEGLGP